MTKQELAKLIYDTAYLTGEFLLRSGAVSEHYFDKYLFEADPMLLKAIANAMQPLVPNSNVEAPFYYV